MDPFSEEGASLAESAATLREADLYLDGLIEHLFRSPVDTGFADLGRQVSAATDQIETLGVRLDADARTLRRQMSDETRSADERRDSILDAVDTMQATLTTVASDLKETLAQLQLARTTVESLGTDEVARDAAAAQVVETVNTEVAAVRTALDANVNVTLQSLSQSLATFAAESARRANVAAAEARATRFWIVAVAVLAFAALIAAMVR